MSKIFKLTQDQQDYISKKTGVQNPADVRIIFEVNSDKTEGVIEGFTEPFSRFSIKMCYCGNGVWDSSCCD